MRSFIGFGQVPYIGTPYVNPINFRGRDGVCTPLLFNWLSYGASSTTVNINVRVDLSPQPVSKSLKKIKSIYIDNMGSDVPIYVCFPSTGYVVVAQPNSAGWFPVYTADFVLWVIGEGFLTGDIPTTEIFVCNIEIEASVDIELATAVSLWKASASITRGNTIYNANFGAPALGDQTLQPSVSLSVNDSVANLFPVSSGFIYLTSVNLFGFFDNSAGAAQDLSMIIESTGVSGILFSLRIHLGVAAISMYPAYHENGMQLKLDATQTWRLRGHLSAAVLAVPSYLQCNVVYTVNPS